MAWKPCGGSIIGPSFLAPDGTPFTITGIELEGHVSRNGKKILFSDTSLKRKYFVGFFIWHSSSFVKF